MLNTVLNDHLSHKNIQIIGQRLTLSPLSVFEAPSALKNAQAEGIIHLGAFSYAVSGYFAFTKIGRYCSFGEQVQIGRQNHPLDWISTSPFLYMNTRQIIDIKDPESIPTYSCYPDMPSPTNPIMTEIGNDVWIGHGAYVKAGVKIGNGAIVAGMSVVTKDVPPYSVVAGNPATVKKYRIPQELITPLIDSQWWDYAPWQLNELPAFDVDTFLNGFSTFKEKFEKYNPPRIHLSSLVDNYTSQQLVSH